MSITALISTSLKVVSMAVVCVASNRRRAMVCLRRDMRTRSSRSGCSTTSLGRGSVTGLGCSRIVAATCSALRRSRKLVTSCLVTRPPGPLAGTLVRLMPCSWAMRFATGVALAIGSTRTAAGSATATGVGLGAWPCSGNSSITPSTSPILTSWPSWHSMRASTPARSATTCMLAFSVSSSTNGSPAATRSPSCFSQSATVASTMDSPISGTTILIGMVLLTCPEIVCSLNRNLLVGRKPG